MTQARGGPSVLNFQVTVISVPDFNIAWCMYQPAVLTSEDDICKIKKSIIDLNIYWTVHCALFLNCVGEQPDTLDSSMTYGFACGSGTLFSQRQLFHKLHTQNFFYHCGSSCEGPSPILENHTQHKLSSFLFYGK